MKITCAALLFPVLLVAQPASKPTDVFALIRENRMAELATWLQTNSPGSFADKLGNQPLHYAALYGSPESVQILLHAGASPDARNSGGVTPLIYAATDAAKARMMLAGGADVRASSRQGRTALHVAAVSAQGYETARMLLDKGAAVDAADDRGDTPLTAANSGNTPLMRLLIERGANARHANRDGMTALINAAGAGNTVIVKLLLDKGADVNAANTAAGRVPRGEIALKQLTPLMLASPYGSPATVKTLLDAGARVNMRDSRGMSALMLAMASDHQSIESVKLLLAAGADVNAKDQVGESVLDWARKSPNPALLRLLEAAGAKAAVAPPVAPQPGEPASLREAIQRSVRLMERSNPVFFKEGGCVACHHQAASGMAIQAVRSAGLDYNREAAAGEAKLSTILTIPFGAQMLQAFEIGGTTDTATFTALGAMANGVEAGPASDLLAHYIASRQNPDGSWSLHGISRPPMEESDIARTAYAVKVLQHYGWPARRSEFAARMARARAWLESAKPTTSYEAADLALGLRWTNSPKSAAAVRQLIALQRPGGGWAQTAHMAPDAYATGLALYALRESGMPPSSRPYEKGMAFLLRTQMTDGSWFVRSRAAKFQPYFQSGFPHDHDQWLSMVATAYAVRVLAPAAAGIRMTASR